MQTIDDLRAAHQRLAAHNSPDGPTMAGPDWWDDVVALSRAATDTTPADAEWFSTLGAVESDDDGHAVLTVGGLSFTIAAETRAFSRPWFGWSQADVYGDAIDPWPVTPPTRGHVVLLLLAIVG